VNNYKKLKRLLCAFLIYLGYQTTADGQSKAAVKNDAAAFCETTIEGLNRPKGLIIREELISSHRISSFQQGNSQKFGKVQQTRRREIKLKAPLWNSPGFKLAIGFKYKVEDVFFNETNAYSSEFYNDLEGKNLNQLGVSLYAIKPLRGNTYLLLRASASLNGDYSKQNAPTGDYLKYSLAPMIGWRINDFTTYAVGLAYSENFGRISVFPLLSFNKTFNDRWGTEILLPLHVKLRYNTPNKKNFIYLKSEVKGSTYNVSFKSGKMGYLNNTEIRHLVSYEREIYDFLWVGVEAGLRSTLNFSLSETADHKNSVVIENRLNQSFFTGFSIFIVPPRKFGH